MRRARVYIAGPDVFLPDAVEVGALKKRLCADYGFFGLYPFDNEIVAGAPDMRVDQLIYAANVLSMRDGDFAIFNLTPFRGVSADVGTVFELGLCVGLEMPVFAYSNDDADLAARIRRDPRSGFDGSGGQPVDGMGLTVEDFGNVDNLMIDGALRAQGRAIHRVACADPLRDLTGFEACLSEAHRAGIARRSPDRLTA